MFGPLWEECLIGLRGCAALVRAAAVAGGRAVRATMPLYQHAYAERARSLDALVAQHTLPATFEAFVERLREPVPAPAPAHGNHAPPLPPPARPNRRARTKHSPDT